MNRQNLAGQDSGAIFSGAMSSSAMPRGNPCAQCGKPIARPDWVEHGEGRSSYLWNCRVCNYRFEAIAIYDEAQLTPLAA